LTSRLILHPRCPRNCSKSVDSVAKRLALRGRRIRIRFLPGLSAGIRKLYSNRPYGQPVYAATFIRRRQIVLDQELQRQTRELKRILVHELFHFAWVHLGNQARDSYQSLLTREWKQRARGELGWSAEMRKSSLLSGPQTSARNAAKWREYACESFCDTAAWLYSGLRRHAEFTLAPRYRNRRAAWFAATFGRREISI
jgi:hypothetical protein